MLLGISQGISPGGRFSRCPRRHRTTTGTPGARPRRRLTDAHLPDPATAAGHRHAVHGVADRVRGGPPATGRRDRRHGGRGGGRRHRRRRGVRPRGAGEGAGAGRADARAVRALADRHRAARQPRRLAALAPAGDADDRQPHRRHLRTRLPGGGDVAVDLAADRHLLGGASGHGRRLRGAQRGDRVHRRAEFLGGDAGGALPGDLVGGGRPTRSWCVSRTIRSATSACSSSPRSSWRWRWRAPPCA